MELRTIIPPEKDIRNLELSSLINVTDIQVMMDNFYQIAGIPMAIIDLKGNILVTVGFQEICTRFHRVHPETLRNCLESDLKLTADIPKGEFRLYKCKNGMWDMATPIFIGDHNIGNLFIGQFFFKDESIDYQHFRNQASKYAFDMADYIGTLEKVPHLDKKDIECAKLFFLRLTDSLSQLSYSNFKLAHLVEETKSLTSTLRQDIIERKKTERLLEENKAHLERSQEIAHLGSWELDILNDRLRWSDEVYRIFGLAPGEFDATYEAFLGAIHPDDRDIVNYAYTSSIQEGLGSYEIEHRIVRKKTGEIRYVHEKCEHFSDHAGRIIRSVGMVHDITEYKKAEKELKDSKDKLNIALEIGKIGVWEWDLRSDDVFLDARVEKMFGLEPGTVNLTYNDIENLLHQEDIMHFKKTISKALNEDMSFETIFRISTRENEEKYINAKAFVEKEDAGELVKMTGVCIDITEMKRGVENVLFKLNEELLRSNKALEQFAYVASHDLQEPLRMVSSFTQMLSLKYNDRLDEDARDYIRFAVEGAERMYDMINGLLAFSRIQSRGKEFRIVDMNSVMEQVLRNLSVKINESRAIIKWENLPAVRADEVQMVQLMQNLVSNALKFNKRRPRIRISSESTKPETVFSVSDNGIGIDSQYSERIFKIFQRLVDRNEYEGTGIGLAICKIIVEGHGGTIWVESDPGKGTTFYFTIPGKTEQGVRSPVSE